MKLLKLRHSGSSRATLTHYAVGALTLCALTASAPTSASANASVFVNTGAASCPYGICKSASTFGLLIGPSDALSIAGTTTVLNDIGLKSGATLTTTNTVNVGNASNSDIVDFADTGFTNSAVPCTGAACTHPTGSSFSTGTKIWGGTQSNASLVNTAYTQFTDLVTYWNGRGGSLGAPTMSGTWDIGTSPGVHLYTATGNLTMSSDLTIGCGTGLTSACDPTDLIVIIVPSADTVSISRGINFATASKLTDDQLLFLVNSNSSTALTIGANATRTVHGDFFAPNGAFTLGDSGGNSTTDFYGRIFANATTGVDTVNHSVTVEPEGEVPEPATWAIMLGGFAGLLYLRHRKPAV